MTEIKKITKHIFIYGLPGVVSQFLALFLVPIYTRLFVPADYGVLALLTTVSGLLSIFLSLGMGTAVFRSYFFKDSVEDKKLVINTAFWFLIIFSGVFLITVSFFAPQISQLVFGTPNYTFLVKISLFTLFFQLGLVIPFALLRAQEKSLRYSAIAIFQLICGVILAIILVVILRRGIEGAVLAGLYNNMVTFVLALIVISPHLSFKFSKAFLKDMLEFGVPMVPAGFAVWALNISDRFFLKYYSDLSQVGLYSIGYRIGQLVVLIVGAVQLAWPPFLFSVAKQRNAKEIYSKFLTFYVFGMIFIILGLSIFAKPVLMILTPPKYWSAYIVVPLVALSYFAYGLYYQFAPGINIKKKTIYASIITIIGGLVCLVLNFFLISRYKMMGAAWATLLGYSSLPLMMLFINQKIYPIKYDWNRILRIFTAGFVIYFLSLFIKERLIFEIGLRGLLILSYFPLLYLVGGITKDEIRGFWSIVKKLYRDKFGKREFEGETFYE